MTPLLLGAVALAGGAGAVARFVVDGAVTARIRGRLPVGTVLVNLTGSLALGLVVGLTTAHVLPGPIRAVLGTGFLGGYTTLSSASVEAARLIRYRVPVPALIVVVGVPLGATALAALGLAVGTAL